MSNIMPSWLKRSLALLVAAGLGAVIAVFVLQQHNQPKLLGLGTEKFIPAQTLRILDGSRQEVGELTILTSGLIVLDLLDGAKHGLLHYTTGLLGPGTQTPLLQVYGLESDGKIASLNAFTEPNLDLWLEAPDGKHINVQSKEWTDQTSVGILTPVYRAVVPEKPPMTPEGAVPSEDLRLVDRQHHVLIILGLSEAAEPCIALIGPEGRLVAVLSIGGAGPFDQNVAKEWPTLTLYDRHGISRIELDLGPDPEPKLSITEHSNNGGMETFALNPQTGEEVHLRPFDDKTNAIPWLAHQMPRLKQPTMLVDEHGNVIWTAH